MKPGPAFAVKLLPTVLSITSPPRLAREWIAEIAIGEGWHSSPSEALEAAEGWEGAFMMRLHREYSNLTEVGRPCLFGFNSSSEYMIQGAAFIEEGVDDDRVKEAKRSLSFVDEYVLAIATLTPSQFEWLCRGILHELGVVDVRLTPRSGDEGIDFYGRLALEGRLRDATGLPSVERRLVIWMIGQAKHYQATQVATPDIRELVGAVTLARARAYGGPQGNKYEDLAISVCDPVFFLFFTTGRISIDGWRLLINSGVIAMDGEMVASFLAEQRVGLNVRMEFDNALLVEWVMAHGE